MKIHTLDQLSQLKKTDVVIIRVALRFPVHLLNKYNALKVSSVPLVDINIVPNLEPISKEKSLSKLVASLFSLGLLFQRRVGRQLLVHCHSATSAEGTLAH